MTEHKNITDPNNHEPKGASTALEGSVYKSDGAGSGNWEVPLKGSQIGVLDYNDLATQTTPLVVPTGSVWVYVPNDGAGPFTNLSYPPEGITDVWDVAAQKFDWSELQLGDMVDMRIDFEITTTGANQDVSIALEMDTDGTPYDITFIESSYKVAGIHKINRYNGIYIGNAGTLTGKARFKIKSDASATLKVNGWYCKVIINR